MKEEYVSRINRVIDHIESNLDAPLPLEQLAKIAHFSRFHFHRIFGAMVGETVNQFVQRKRVEKAASQLIHIPKKSVTEIALDCGYTSPATFARAFKNHFGMSASDWRAGGRSDVTGVAGLDQHDADPVEGRHVADATTGAPAGRGQREVATPRRGQYRSTGQRLQCGEIGRHRC